MCEAICFDLGDTLVAEGTVIHDSSGQAIAANVIEGAFKVLKAIREDGYKVAIIANGDSNSCRNIIKVTGLQDYFDAIIISEEAGIEKPDQEIFNIALAKLGVKAENAVMVGNRIDADIIGANRIGMKSIWFKWNNRYEDKISDQKERPNFIIKELVELPQLLNSIFKEGGS
jgi:putative hydrolase of the HAD superfamily